MRTHAPARVALDITDATTIAAALDARSYAVINAAAYTTVDRAESDVAEAYPTNSGYAFGKRSTAARASASPASRS